MAKSVSKSVYLALSFGGGKFSIRALQSMPRSRKLGELIVRLDFTFPRWLFEPALLKCSIEVPDEALPFVKGSDIQVDSTLLPISQQRRDSENVNP